MDCGGAMRIGEEARSVRRTLGEGEGVRNALERKRRKWEQWTLSVEVRDFPLLLTDFIDPQEPRSPNRALCTH
jgi:hypothetical protein